MDFVREFVDEFSVSEPEELIDSAVCPIGRNGLHLAPQKKKGRTTHYYCFFTCEITKRHPENVQQFDYEEGTSYVKENVSTIYSFVFETPDWERFGEVLEEVPPPAVADVRITTETEFDLQLFLEATKSHVPSHPEWLQIVSYLVSIHYPKKDAVELMNRYWNPTDQTENATVFDNMVYSDAQPVTRGSVVRYLSLYGMDFDIRDIFKQHRNTGFYNDHQSITKSHRTLAEIEDMFKGIISYVYSNNMFVWKYRVNERDRHGNKRIRVQTQITKDPPFVRWDAIYLDRLMVPDEVSAELRRFMKINKNSVPACTALLSSSKTMSATAYRKKACEILNDKPTVQAKSEIIVADLQKKREFPRYSEVDFQPYTGFDDPCSVEVLNTFSGFSHETYVPTVDIDIRKTLTWRYLCVVFGHDEKYNDRVGELMDRVAWKFQNLNIRSRRLHVLYSRAQGCGKSMFFLFLSMVFGMQYCVFHSSMDGYTCKFNLHLNSKLVHFIDDLAGCTNKQTRKLYPLVTSETQAYEGKGCKVITMSEKSELWVTGNQNSASLHVCAEDRRIVIYEAANTLKGDFDFWKALHLEMDNTNVAHAFYMFLKTRDVSRFHPETSHVASTRLKSLAVADAMTKSHVFVERFFSEPNFHNPTELHKLGYMPQEWAQQISISKRNRPKERAGQVLIRISQTGFYKCYTLFMRTYFPSSKAHNMTTFFKQITDVGLVVQENRQRINKVTHRTVDCYWDDFSTEYKDRYQMNATPWVTTQPDMLKIMISDLQTLSS
jgi:hypothetical protein